MYWISCRVRARSARRAELPTASSGLASASYEASQAMKRTTPGAVMRYRKPSLHFGNPRLALRGSRGHSQSKSALRRQTRSLIIIKPERSSRNAILREASGCAFQIRGPAAVRALVGLQRRPDMLYAKLHELVPFTPLEGVEHLAMLAPGSHQ